MYADADRGPQTADGGMDDGRWTVDGCRTGFRACRRELPSTNAGTNKRIQTADGGWTMDGGPWTMEDNRE